MSEKYIDAMTGEIVESEELHEGDMVVIETPEQMRDFVENASTDDIYDMITQLSRMIVEQHELLALYAAAVDLETGTENKELH